MKSIFLIRHGQYIKSNSHELGQSYSLNELLLTTDGPLSSIGTKQALQLGSRLKQQKIHTIHFSSLQRTRETFDVIHHFFEGTNFSQTELLWECLPTMPSNPGDEISPLSEREIKLSKEKADNAFSLFFTPCKEKQSADLLICHGNLIRYFVSKALNMPPESWEKMDVMNCSLSQIDVNADGSYTLISFNDTGHLEENLKTYS